MTTSSSDFPIPTDIAEETATPVEPGLLLRQILTLSAEFEAKVGSALSVNKRDFEAMQHLLMDGPLGPTEIAHRLGVTTAAATVVVDRLVAAGHVGRQPHPTDRRGVVVVPEPASIAAALGHIMPLVRGVGDVLYDFKIEERLIITRYLQRVVGVYQQQLSADSDT
ncbi:MAG: MarR family transcriptional regulator [Glaciihabitans sp.]|nr:MarR family transcriptional regulator [Glaciihabitans sp.]